MKTVGQLLKSAREKKELSLIDIEKATKIRAKYLIALENDQYRLLPSGTYAKGFIKNYAGIVNIPVETALAVFRRDFTEDEKGQILPRSMAHPISRQPVIWTPKATAATLVTAVLVIFIAFIIFQYQGLFRPHLQVTIPTEGEILLGPTILVSGITDSSAVVSINQQLTTVNSDGSFNTQLDVSSGEVTLNIEATNSRGYQTVVQRKIIVRLE